MLAVALFLFIFGRLVPEALALRYTEPLALALVRPMRWMSIALAPLVRFAVVLSNWLAIPMGGQKREGAALVTEEELKTMVDAGEEEGLIEEEEKEMILSVLDFGDTIAREVMVPRIDIVALEVNTPFSEALNVVVSAGHSRIPVYRGTIDDIIGVLYAKDMLAALRDQKTPSLNKCCARSTSRRSRSASSNCSRNSKNSASTCASWWTSMAALPAWSPSRTSWRRSSATSRMNMTPRNPR